MPDRQETFDTVVAHLRKQGAKAETFDPTVQGPVCMYRAEDGKKCAAGCLIPDDRYNPALEYTSVGGTVSYRGGALNAVTQLMEELGHDIQLVRDLQDIHDGKPVRDWEEEFRQLAIYHGLRYTPATENHEVQYAQ